MTSYSEAGREKNAPKMTCSSYLFLVRLCLGEIFALGYMLFPTMSHVSSFLSSSSTPTFSYNGKTTSPAVQPSQMTKHVQVQADRCLSYFWINVEVVSSDFSDCCLVFFATDTRQQSKAQRGEVEERQMVTSCGTVFILVFAIVFRAQGSRRAPIPPTRVLFI